jgi:beta-barrel assembly-enhancing protease
MKFVPKRLIETAEISRGKTTFAAFLRNSLLVVLFFATVYWLLGLTAFLLASKIPDRWEKNLAGAAPFLGGEHERLAAAEEILGRLLEAEGLRDLEYRLYLVNFPGPNAMAFPGGGIGVTPDLLDLLENEAGLAFVLAHEIGHHQHRHILHRLGRGILFGVFSSLLGGDGMAPVGGAIRVADLTFSRGQEHEADAEALRRVHQVYGNLDGALEFFEALEAKDPEGDWVQYFSTHPLTRDRLVRLRALVEELDGARPVGEGGF